MGAHAHVRAHRADGWGLGKRDRERERERERIEWGNCLGENGQRNELTEEKNVWRDGVGADCGILEAAQQESLAKPCERKKDQEPKQTRLRYPDTSPLKKKQNTSFFTSHNAFWQRLWSELPCLMSACFPSSGKAPLEPPNTLHNCFHRLCAELISLCRIIIGLWFRSALPIHRLSVRQCGCCCDVIPGTSWRPSSVCVSSGSVSHPLSQGVLAKKLLRGKQNRTTTGLIFIWKSSKNCSYFVCRGHVDSSRLRRRICIHTISFSWCRFSSKWQNLILEWNSRTERDGRAWNQRN